MASDKEMRKSFVLFVYVLMAACMVGLGWCVYSLVQSARLQAVPLPPWGTEAASALVAAVEQQVSEHEAILISVLDRQGNCLAFRDHVRTSQSPPPGWRAKISIHDSYCADPSGAHLIVDRDGTLRPCFASFTGCYLVVAGSSTQRNWQILCDGLRSFVAQQLH